MARNTDHRWWRVLLWPLLLSWLLGCAGQRPILVGFSGELTGKHSNMGVDGRDGAQLAVEVLNEAGGVDGRPLELLVRDDHGTSEGALAADRALIDAGVVAIIGHMTSDQSLAALPLIEEEGVVLLSPTTSSAALSGQEDHFFRVVNTNAQEAQALARHVYQERAIARVAVIYDSDNVVFTRGLWEAFLQTYRPLGGELGAEVSFSAASEPDFAPLVAALRKGDPEGVLIVASALDTALIAQRIRLDDWAVPLFTSGWANAETLVQSGGQAVEGMELVISYSASNPSPAFQAFRQRYQERFGRQPTFAAGFAYEAVLVLAEALDSTGGRAEGLPEALTQVPPLQAPSGPLTLDAYGDAVRTLYLARVEQGEFVPLYPLLVETQP